MAFLAGLAGLPLAIIQASLFEWAFHRYWLHRPWLPKDVFTAHTLIHHQLCKFDDTFHVEEEEQHEALHFQWWGGPFLVSLNILPWIMVSWALAAAGITPINWFLIGTVAITCSLYYVGYEGLHYLMHKPSVQWLERMPYFQFIKRHHRIHHVRMDRNLNVLVPIADFLLGTLVRETASSGPTPEAARTLARRHSRFGRRMRDGQS